MFLVGGLGNPGPKYCQNRHNAGFMVVDWLADHWGAGSFREKFQGEFVKVARQSGPDVILLKPQTFMNLSGVSVQKAMAFFNISLERVIVVHDELDLPFGECRLKKGGGSAGHNGLKSVTQHCGGPGYLRLRFGIDRPRGRPEGYVLSDFSSSERAELAGRIEHAGAMVVAALDLGIDAAMNRYHAPK